MADLALPRQLHLLGQRAIAEARLRRAGTVEAEHLLLAILSDRSGAVTRRLALAGLDYDAFVTALDAERARSLAAAGIARTSLSVPAATPRTARPGWGASVRDVLRGADKPASKSGGAAGLQRELAATILAAKLGTVPRALSLAGLDRTTLRAAVSSVQSSVAQKIPGK
jgi:ATP-dependent Clp protease ATP-binding subunit ClpA